MRALILVATIFITSISLASAQQPGEPPNSQTSTTTQPSGTSANAPVPVPEPSEKALAYYHSGIVLWIFSTLWGWLIPGLFLFTGFSARIRDWSRRIGGGWFLTIGVYFAIFVIITFLIDLPLSYYTGYVRQHAYGLSNQTIGKWIKDTLISLGLGIGFGFLTLWIPYLMLKR